MLLKSYIRRQQQTLRWFHTTSSCYFSSSILTSTSEQEDVVILPTKLEKENKIYLPQMTVKQVLTGRTPNTFTLKSDTSIKNTMNHIVVKKLSSSLVLNSDDEIVGIVTARDVLKFVNNLSSEQVTNRALKGSSSTNALLQHKVSEVMTPVEKMIYCSPKDTVFHCREIMFQMKIRHMPVLQGNSVVGIVTLSDLSDAEFDNIIHGGKKGYISNVMGRKGLPRGTRVFESVDKNNNIGQLDSSQLSHLQQMTVVRSGSYTLPHPFKTHNGVAGNRRQYGPEDLCEDNDLNEDSHFVMTVQMPNVEASKKLKNSEVIMEQVYACVADGVGSWRQYGVDPRMYSRRLVENAKNVILAECSRRLEDFMLYQTSRRTDKGVDVSAAPGGIDIEGEEVHPLDAISEAWLMTNKSEEVIGSSTICVATIDVATNQLSYSNIGDGGLMVVRHTPMDGTLNANVDATLDTSDNNSSYKIAYLAQQQLRSFNFPFQLGNGGDSYDGYFEQPLDADTAFIPLMAGDIVVMATDGLFDNLDITEIISIIANWEQDVQKDQAKGSDKVVENNSSYDERAESLAKSLVLAAREASLDKDRDSPFALLAKENDIMWGGGMPDDTTVVIMQLASV